MYQNVSGFVNVSDEQVYFDAEKSIKQTLFQFQHLQKVWQEVLPGSIYRKAVGKIFHNCRQEKFVNKYLKYFNMQNNLRHHMTCMK